MHEHLPRVSGGVIRKFWVLLALALSVPGAWAQGYVALQFDDGVLRQLERSSYDANQFAAELRRTTQLSRDGTSVRVSDQARAFCQRCQFSRGDNVQFADGSVWPLVVVTGPLPPPRSTAQEGELDSALNSGATKEQIKPSRPACPPGWTRRQGICSSP